MSRDTTRSRSSFAWGRSCAVASEWHSGGARNRSLGCRAARVYFRRTVIGLFTTAEHTWLTFVVIVEQSTWSLLSMERSFVMERSVVEWNPMGKMLFLQVFHSRLSLSRCLRLRLGLGLPPTRQHPRPRLFLRWVHLFIKFLQWQFSVGLRVKRWEGSKRYFEKVLGRDKEKCWPYCLHLTLVSQV